MPYTIQEIKKAKSVQLLSHYFKTVFKKAGLNWDSDNDSEMQELVDCIIEATKED